MGHACFGDSLERRTISVPIRMAPSDSSSHIDYQLVPPSDPVVAICKPDGRPRFQASCRAGMPALPLVAEVVALQ